MPMYTALPSRIMDYNVSSASPTDELMTLGRILSEVGGYASTLLDREHLSLSRKCGIRLRKVVGELASRQSIRSEGDLYEMPRSELSCSDLSALSITELHDLYRRWPIRHREREAEGRERFTFYLEGRIVGELMRRKPAGKAQQLEIDYCVATYHNELDNMSLVFSRPVMVDGEKINPEYGRSYSPDELSALIRLYSGYRDILEREILVEYVDYALDFLESGSDGISSPGLIAELAELGRRKILRVPVWVDRKLEETVRRALRTGTANDSELALAMLTLQMLDGDSTLTREARRIINRCYKTALEDGPDLGGRIESLHTAVTCCDYVSRFSVRKAASLWNELSGDILSSGKGLSSRHIFQMLEIAEECGDYAPVSAESRHRLGEMLARMSDTFLPEARAYGRIAALKFRYA